MNPGIPQDLYSDTILSKPDPKSRDRNTITDRPKLESKCRNGTKPQVLPNRDTYKKMKRK
ncbi:hypothetical protein LINPERHAP2_LOCUS23521, partial [Linum perenne]